MNPEPPVTRTRAISIPPLEKSTFGDDMDGIVQALSEGQVAVTESNGSTSEPRGARGDRDGSSGRGVDTEAHRDLARRLSPSRQALHFSRAFSVHSGRPAAPGLAIDGVELDETGHV